MLFFLPYNVDVPMARWPLANFCLVLLTTVVSAMAMTGEMTESTVRSMVLDGWALEGMFGHVFLHADYFHLFGNMVFLWVFGNGVCAKVGNLLYIPIYFLMALAAAAATNLIDPNRVIGASGAINGIVGMFLVWYPLNNISCFYVFIIKPGVVYLSSYWIILLWLGFDILGVIGGDTGVAYWAHLGGFAFGFAFAMGLSFYSLVLPTSYERDLFQVQGWPRHGEGDVTGRGKAPPARKERATSPH